MDDYSSRYLHYTRASLADSLRQAPDLSINGVPISLSEYTSGQLSQSALKELFDLRRREAKPGTQDDALWPLTVAICPWVYSLKPEHAHESHAVSKLITPVVMWAKVTSAGTLFPYEAPGVRARPFIPRELLDPSDRIITFGKLEEVDEIYATLQDVDGQWSTLVAQADELISRLTGRTPTKLDLDTHVLATDACCVLNVPRAGHLHIQKLTDLIAEAGTASLPLHETLLTTTPDRPIKCGAELIELSEAHVGQMESQYPLSASQREALLHQLALWSEAPSVLAVDGPPGTGKTTLLLSVIGTLWVQRALAGGDPPLLVASSTNNQAVVNILEAFSKVKEKESPLAGRWLPDIHSYGLFLCAKGREDLAADRQFPIHTFTDLGDQARFGARALEEPEGFTNALKMFLSRFSAAFGAHTSPTLEEAAATLQSHLKNMVASATRALQALRLLSESVPLETMTSEALNRELTKLSTLHEAAHEASALAAEGVHACLKLRQQWKQHVVAEPWWVGLLCALGIRSPRRNRDALFCSTFELANRRYIDSSLRTVTLRGEIDEWMDRLPASAEAEHRKAVEHETRARHELDGFSAALQEVKHWTLDGELTPDTVQAALDIGPRFDAFKLATHYWEARYLLEVQERMKRSPPARDTKSVPGLKIQYRRLAKLFPCSVCTLYMLPKYFVGWSGRDEPMYDAIDLLIVDEAGQVAPEIGTPAFALAKRALVVGDVDQLAPIWGVGPFIDRRNAQRYGLIDKLEEYEALQENGRAAYKGNLMRVAQRASPFTKNASRGRGMFLSEHRRCWREIIAICNSLVYGELLQPVRTEGPRRLLPSVGYVHIAAVDQPEGKSRKNSTEATAIAKWLRGRKEQIEKAFAEDRKPFGKLVTIVTPFNAQARVIRRALRVEFGDTQGITVGTVHSLQGAECRIVIFSPTYGLGTPPGSTFFDQDRSMLNVAVSRAQDAFLVFGNMDLFRPVGDHPAAVVGRHLFQTGENELADVPIELVVPTINLEHTELIHELEAHRAILQRAFAEARFRLVIVSPFLTRRALEADQVLEQIKRALERRSPDSALRIMVISDQALNTNRSQYKECLQSLQEAGAQVHSALKSGVHSKLLLVDSKWLVVGSFNWLSAVRDPSDPLSRHDSSIRYDGPKAVEMIGTSLKDLAEILSRPTTAGD